MISQIFQEWLAGFKAWASAYQELEVTGAYEMAGVY